MKCNPTDHDKIKTTFVKINKSNLKKLEKNTDCVRGEFI